MEELRRLMEFESLWALWFWIMHIMTWSLNSHFVMGVPFDMVVQANREKDETGPWSIHCDAMVQASVFRIVTTIERYGAVIIGVWSFLMGSLATFAFHFGNEFSIAVFTLLAPLTLIYALSVLGARKIDRLGLRGPALRVQMRRLRFWVQVCGALGIVMAGMAAVWSDVRNVTPLI